MSLNRLTKRLDKQLRKKAAILLDDELAEMIAGLESALGDLWT